MNVHLYFSLIEEIFYVSELTETMTRQFLVHSRYSTILTNE